MESVNERHLEADALSRYLVGAPVSDEVKEQYWRALEHHGADYNDRERRVWRYMVSGQMTMRCVDAGLALTAPTSTLRKRIFIMLAILETEPSYADHFLPQDRPVLYIVPMVLAGMRAVACAVVGLFLVKWWRLA